LPEGKDQAVSPLAKRLKLSENRRGASGLKIEVYKHNASESDEGGSEMESPSGSANDADGDGGDSDDVNSLDRRAEDAEDAEEGELESVSDDEADDEEDFLARDLADSWG
jgi:RNA polymerase II subunit A C-terminal domain phosphatase